MPARHDFETLPDDPAAPARAQFEALRSGSGSENAFDIATELKNVMFEDVGIYRNEKGMRDAIEKLAVLRKRFANVRITDTGSIFNTELLNAWELGNMLEIAEVVAPVRRQPPGDRAAGTRARTSRSATTRTG